jgi:cell fate regulator YaaT (PSP1 superfamily)
MKEDNKVEQVQKAYIYLVKTPSSNDLAVCASSQVLTPGTKVVAPTRYGLDLGIVIGSASTLGKTYSAGCNHCLGACHFEPTNIAHEEDLAANGYVQEGNVVCETEGQLLSLGPLPQFEFVKATLEPQSASTQSATKQSSNPTQSSNTPTSQPDIWDKAYKAPELVEVDGDVAWIDHVATKQELEKYENNKQAELDAICVCREKIGNLKLNMKLVTAHFLLCEPKVLFFFTADERVDFRELVKELVSVFRMRIELRQIGVRDESRVLGGLAVCGRDFCCHCVSDKLNPVTIKMAKEQNLSLNSMKISGPCGRLLCCLSYEYDFYCEEKQAYPPEGAKIKLGNELFRVQEVNILSHKMTLTGSEGRSYILPREEVYFNSDNGHWEVDRAYQDELLSN